MGTTCCASWFGPALHTCSSPRRRRRQQHFSVFLAKENPQHVVPLAITISYYVLDSSPTFKEFQITLQLEALRLFSRKFHKPKFHLR